MTITAEQATNLLEGTTPGPWRPSKSYRAIVSDSPSGYDDAESVHAYGGHMVCESVQEHNRHLIAAAPDLARALIASEAARKLAEERLAKVMEGLSALDRAAGEVARQGAVTGSQWTRLGIAMLKARAILKEIDNG